MVLLAWGGLNVCFPPQRSSEQAPLNVSQKGRLTFPQEEQSEGERCV